LAEAVRRAQDPLVADDGAAADVAVVPESQRDLPRELSMAGIDAVDDAGTAAPLSTQVGGGNGGDEESEESEEADEGLQINSTIRGTMLKTNITNY
jgi:hypothetical protein